MLDAILPIVFSLVLLSIGSFMVYMMLKDKQKWDRFWENENRQIPLIPEEWAESNIVRMLTDLLALCFFLVSLILTISSILELLK